MKLLFRIAFAFSTMIVFVKCEEPITLANSYSEEHFSNDFKALLENGQIDSLIYYQGLIESEKTYQSIRRDWMGKTYAELVKMIKYVNEEDEFKEQIVHDTFLVRSYKLPQEGNQLRIKFEVESKVSDLVQLGDTIELAVSYYNSFTSHWGAVTSVPIIEENRRDSIILRTEDIVSLDIFDEEYADFKWKNETPPFIPPSIVYQLIRYDISFIRIKRANLRKELYIFR